MKGYSGFTARLPSLRWFYCRRWFLKNRRPDLAAKKVIPDNKRCSRIKSEMEAHIGVILRDRELTALQLTNLFFLLKLVGKSEGFPWKRHGDETVWTPLRGREDDTTDLWLINWFHGFHGKQKNGEQNERRNSSMRSISGEGGERGTLLNNSLSIKRVWGVVWVWGWWSEPLQTGFSAIQVLCHSRWEKCLIDAVQLCINDDFQIFWEPCWNREIAGFRSSAEVGLWFMWKTKF